MKASNIYQKLKSAGIGNPDGVSSKPLIKDVGIKSPLNMKSPNKMMPSKEVIEAAKNKIQKNKNAKARSEGKAVSYKDAYADADKKKYKTYEEFEKAAKSYNKKKYNTENPTSEAKKQNISKKKLAENVKNKNNPPKNDPPKNDPPKNEDTPKNEDAPKTNVVKNTRKEVAASNKEKRQARRAERQAKRAERIKKTGGTKVGNLLRKGKEKVAKLVEKKDKSPAAMKKGSAMKMGKKSPMKMAKKGSAAKMAKSPNKFNKGLKKAAADGKLDKNPKFKAAVENAPAKMKKSAMKMKKSAAKMKYKK